MLRTIPITPLNIFPVFCPSPAERIDVDQPLWDQSTFYGRFRHMAFLTDPTTVLASNDELLAAKKLVNDYR